MNEYAPMDIFEAADALGVTAQWLDMEIKTVGAPDLIRAIEEEILRRDRLPASRYNYCARNKRSYT